jgi:hypothetical protein
MASPQAATKGGEVMRSILLSVWAVAVLAGCQSTQNSWHIEGDVIKNTRVERYPAMFTAPYTKTFHQECPVSARLDSNMYEGFDQLNFWRCVTMKVEINGVAHDHWDQAFEPGTLNGLGGSLIQAGAILGGARLLAQGYRAGGSRLSTHTENSLVNTNSINFEDPPHHRP